MIRKPILYPSNQKSFTTNGKGVMVDAISCEVTEELDGAYELVMKFPVGSKQLSSIQLRNIIYAMASDAEGMQPFRIYRITKPMNSIVTIYAEHISYDLNGVQVSPFVATNAEDALYEIKNNSTTENAFNFYTDKATIATMMINTPRSVRACLFGQSGSLLDTYSGDLRFDHFKVHLLSRRGTYTSFKIKYGVNLKSLTQEQSNAYMFTGIYPYYFDELTGTLVELEEKILTGGNFTFDRIKAVDFTSYFDTVPTEEQLRSQAEAYLNTSDLGTGTSNITLKFETLRGTEEYKNISVLEDIALGDYVTVEYEEFGISGYSRCVKTVYDSLLMRYKSVELGTLKGRISNTILTLENTVRESVTKAGNAIKSVARLQVTSDDQGAQIEAITEWIGTDKSGAIKTIAEIQQKADANGAKISLVVATNEEGRDYVKGSVLIEAINGESTATINANRVNLEGYVSISNLENGTTQIDGAWIKTGSIDAARINTKGLTAEHIAVSDEDGNVLFEADTQNHVVRMSAAVIEGKLTAKQINTTGLTAEYIAVTDEDGNTLFKADTTGGAVEMTAAAITGKLTAEQINGTSLDITDGVFENCTINETCQIYGTVRANNISSYTNDETGHTGAIFYQDTDEQDTFQIGITSESTKVANLLLIAGNPNGDQSDVWLTLGITDEGGLNYTDFLSIYEDRILMNSTGEEGMIELISGKNISLRGKFINIQSTGDEKSNIQGDWLATGAWSFTSTPTFGSDRNIKHDISDISERYSAFFDNLRPVICRHNSDSTDRLHVNYIAQEVYDALVVSGLTMDDFAGVVIQNEGREDELWTLRYNEFIPLNTLEIQKVKQRLERLEAILGG